MAEEGDRESLMRKEYLGQTARLPWTELQTYYAHGNVIRIATTLDLVEVAVQLGLDNTTAFETWIAAGDIAPVSDDEAKAWIEDDASVWAVVAAPWILVQDKAHQQG